MPARALEDNQSAFKRSSSICCTAVAQNLITRYWRRSKFKRETPKVTACALDKWSAFYRFCMQPQDAGDASSWNPLMRCC